MNERSNDLRNLASVVGLRPNSVGLKVLFVFLFLFSGMMSLSSAIAGPVPEPAHDRPYFMPESRKQEIFDLISREAWAKKEYEKIKENALEAHSLIGKPKFTRRDGWQREAYWAAFLYALEGRQEYLEVARAWLKHAYGNNSRQTKRARRTLDDPEYWKGSEQGVPWYRLDIEAYVAYDWIYKGLEEEEREYLHEVLRLQTEYRMKCMDNWTSTPNLNFKPIFVVAFAGMALRDQHILEWGWERQERQGNFYSMMDRILKDQGIWHEACIYPVGHSGMWAINTMAFYRSIYEQENWFDKPTPGDATARGLTDYFIDTAYPREKTGDGPPRHRVVTYGDGATTPPVYGTKADLFIGGLPRERNRRWAHMRDGLAMAYAHSGESRYAAFLSLFPEYKPNLWDRRPLPENIGYPEASSSVWPEFGLAMLRSDESSNYYTNPDAIAAFQMMTKGYGHDHPDKFQLTLFGAERLLYPDYLINQYEERQIGWTYTSASQNTMLVDEKDTPSGARTGSRRGDIEPEIRHAFTPDVKFLATSAQNLFPGVRQTRVLFLSDQYLLELFHAASKTPHTYDYVLHSLGEPKLLTPEQFEKEGPLSRKYWAMDNPRRTTRGEPWSMQFNFTPEPPEKSIRGLGAEWFNHQANVALNMDGAENTELTVSTWGGENYIERYAKVTGTSKKKARGRFKDARVGMVVARRADRRRTTFVAAHEPFANEETPQVQSVTTLAATEKARIVRTDAEGFTDYVAVAWDDTDQKHVLRTSDDERFAFRNYGWLRVHDNGKAVARGDWIGFCVNEPAERLVLNGESQKVKDKGERLVMGETPSGKVSTIARAPECPFPVETEPAELRIMRYGKRDVTLTIRNTLDEAISGTVAFDEELGFITDPGQLNFGPVAPQEETELAFTVYARNAPQGSLKYPFRVDYRRASEQKKTTTAYQSWPAIVDLAVRPDYSGEYVNWWYDGARITSRLDGNGAITYLRDPAGNVRVNGRALFTVRDLSGNVAVEASKPIPGVSIWPQANARVSISSFQMNLDFEADRINDIRLIPRRTNETAKVFTVPYKWQSSGGDPHWKRVIAVDEEGREFDAGTDTDAKIVAAELAFPESEWHLAFQFEPARKVSFDGAGFEFTLPRADSGGNPPGWDIGFCRAGHFDKWRRR